MSPFSEILDVVPRLCCHQPPSFIPNNLAALHYLSFPAYLEPQLKATFSFSELWSLAASINGGCTGRSFSRC